MKDEFMIRQTAEYCYRVASHQGLKFDKAKASDYVQKTYRVRFGAGLLPTKPQTKYNF